MSAPFIPHNRSGPPNPDAETQRSVLDAPPASNAETRAPEDWMLLAISVLLGLSGLILIVHMFA